MQTETLTIERFLYQKTTVPVVKKLLESMNVGPEAVVAALVRYFTDMGLYFVHPGQEKAVFEAMLVQLRQSPDIRKAVPKPVKKNPKIID